jgi:predicted small integral membrane protein
MSAFDWMAWTQGTLAFVAGFFVFLGSITVLAVLRPSGPRKGFLPIETARGDRIYVSLLGSVLVMILFVALTDLRLPLGLIPAAAWVGLVMRWG